MNDGLLGALGLCIKAGKASQGTEMSLKSIKRRNAALVLLDNKASPRTKKDITNSCSYYNVELVIDDLKEEFIKLTQKDKMVIMSINDKGFAGLIKSKLKTKTYDNY